MTPCRGRSLFDQPQRRVVGPADVGTPARLDAGGNGVHQRLLVRILRQRFVKDRLVARAELEQDDPVTDLAAVFNQRRRRGPFQAEDAVVARALGDVEDQHQRLGVQGLDALHNLVSGQHGGVVQLRVCGSRAKSRERQQDEENQACKRASKSKRASD